MSNHSEQIQDLIQALSKAQGSFPSAYKDKTNNFTKSKYASYESMRKSTQDVLAAHGLSIVHILEILDGKRVVTTTVFHMSGQWIKTSLYIAPKDETPHSIGSAITYSMRYSLSSLLALPSGDEPIAEGDTDDDGNKAQGVFLSEVQVNEILNLIGDDEDLLMRMLKGYGKQSITEIVASEFDPICKRINTLKGSK